VNTGTNAAANAPSAVMRRKKLGMRNATKKMSAAARSPSRCANTTSRNKPVKRDSNVIAPITAVERNSLAGMVGGLAGRG